MSDVLLRKGYFLQYPFFVSFSLRKFYLDFKDEKDVIDSDFIINPKLFKNKYLIDLLMDYFMDFIRLVDEKYKIGCHDYLFICDDKMNRLNLDEKLRDVYNNLFLNLYKFYKDDEKRKIIFCKHNNADINTWKYVLKNEIFFDNFREIGRDEKEKENEKMKNEKKKEKRVLKVNLNTLEDCKNWIMDNM